MSPTRAKRYRPKAIGADPIGVCQNPPMSRDEERRQHGRREDRAEMFLGASRASVSNLSVNGAFVSILSGLHPKDTFSFELALDDEAGAPVRGKAFVVWVDPGVGAGVRFELSSEERSRLASYLELIEGVDAAKAPVPGPAEPVHEPPRQARRTVALGPDKPGEPSTVWFKYLPPEGAGEPEDSGE